MLKGKQKKLDKNNNGRIDAEDFKLLKASKKGMRMGGMMYADDGGFMDYYSNTPKVDKKNLDRAGKGVGELVERIIMPPAAAIRDTGKAYKEFKKMQKRKQNKKDVEQIEAKKGKMIRMRSGGMNSDRLTQRDIEAIERAKRISQSGNKARMNALKKALKENLKDTDRLTNRDIKIGSMINRKTGGMLKAKSGKLADAMKKLREKAYEKSGKKYKGVGKFGKDEYLIQKPLPGIKKGKMIKARVGGGIRGTSSNRADAINRARKEREQGEKYTAGAIPGNKAAAASMNKKRGGMLKAKTGKSVDTIKITPTIKGKPLKARPFYKSRHDRGTKSRDYLFSKK